MRVHLLQDATEQIFAKQLLDKDDGKLQFDPITRDISFPAKLLPNSKCYAKSFSRYLKQFQKS
jgi:hypothetical protein